MQSRRMSLIEALSNTIIGFIISWMLQWEVMHNYGVDIPIWEAGLVVSMFTAVSIFRGYLFRRLFNGIEKHKERIKSWLREARKLYAASTTRRKLARGWARWRQS